MNTLTGSAALLFLLLLPDAAAACSCGYTPMSYPERRLAVPAVFHGKVAATGVDDAVHERWIRIAVIRDYSVDGSIVPDTATVWTATQSSLCGSQFPVGEEVLVFANNLDYSTDPPQPAGKLSTSICSRNIQGAGLQEALDAMDEALGVRVRSPRTVPRLHRASLECGQLLLEGRVQANGVLRSAEGGKRRD